MNAKAHKISERIPWVLFSKGWLLEDLLLIRFALIIAAVQSMSWRNLAISTHDPSMLFIIIAEMHPACQLV